MAILYELLAGGERPRPVRSSMPSCPRADRRSGSPREPADRRARLAWADAEPAGAVVIRGARVLDPRAGHRREPATSSSATVEIAELAEPGSGRGRRRRGGRGRRACTLFPAFFDPHVHLRTPGQEHKEDIETGTAGRGRRRLLRDRRDGRTPSRRSTTAADVARAARARPRARPPSRSASSPRVTRGMEGEELTEMAELRDAGAVGFSDDGLPIRSARVLRRALQYQRLVRRRDRPARGGPGALRRRRRCTRARSRPRSASPGSRRSRSRR